MPDDLRTRIAAVLIDHCGDQNHHAVADAVIRELGLRQEESYGTTYPQVPVEDRRLTRYVTDWIADE